MSSPFTPKKVKFRKNHKGHKGHIPGIAVNREFSGLQGGTAAIYMCSNIRVSSKHFEVMRILCSKAIKAVKRGTFQLPGFPHRSLTKKAAETRMGGGKGSPDCFVAMMKAGAVLIEFFDVPHEVIKDIFSQVICKIPGKLSLVFTGSYDAN